MLLSPRPATLGLLVPILYSSWRVPAAAYCREMIFESPTTLNYIIIMSSRPLNSFMSGAYISENHLRLKKAKKENTSHMSQFSLPPPTLPRGPLIKRGRGRWNSLLLGSPPIFWINWENIGLTGRWRGQYKLYCPEPPVRSSSDDAREIDSSRDCVSAACAPPPPYSILTLYEAMSKVCFPYPRRRRPLVWLVPGVCTP